MFSLPWFAVTIQISVFRNHPWRIHHPPSCCANRCIWHRLISTIKKDVKYTAAQTFQPSTSNRGNKSRLELPFKTLKFKIKNNYNKKQKQKHKLLSTPNPTSLIHFPSVKSISASVLHPLKWTDTILSGESGVGAHVRAWQVSGRSRWTVK